jgi:hypothetical protein
MGDPKPIASLTGMLLARKGAARPAMRRPTSFGEAGQGAVTQDDLGWNDMGYDVDPSPTAPMDYDHSTRYNPLAKAVPEVKPEVKLQQERIAEQLQLQAHEQSISMPRPQEILVEPAFESVTAEELAETLAMQVGVKMKPSPVAKGVRIKKRALPGQKEKAAFTLRLNQDRHLKLRLACTLHNRSAQMLVTDALDAYLSSMPELEHLAAQFPSKKSVSNVN